MKCLVAERPPYMVKYNEAWRSTVATRPKCNMAEPVDGAWPAYKWGQVADDFPLVELPPRLVQDFARRLEKRFGHPQGFLNNQMATYYYDGKHQYLKNHQDKAHSCESTGQIESAAPIYNLSLGAPRNFVIADVKSLGKSKRADMLIYADIRMSSGDLVAMRPEMNARFCHGVPRRAPHFVGVSPLHQILDTAASRTGRGSCASGAPMARMGRGSLYRAPRTERATTRRRA